MFCRLGLHIFGKELEITRLRRILLKSDFNCGPAAVGSPRRCRMQSMVHIYTSIFCVMYSLQSDSLWMMVYLEVTNKVVVECNYLDGCFKNCSVQLIKESHTLRLSAIIKIIFTSTNSLEIIFRKHFAIHHA